MRHSVQRGYRLMVANHTCPLRLIVSFPNSIMFMNLLPLTTQKVMALQRDLLDC